METGKYQYDTSNFHAKQWQSSEEIRVSQEKAREFAELARQFFELARVERLEQQEILNEIQQTVERIQKHNRDLGNE